MEEKRVRELRDQYRSALLEDVIPFWMTHSLDHEYGGYLHHLDREGKVFCEDKMMWMEWRQVWMLSTLFNDVEPRREYLDAARLGAEFLMRHGRAENGDLYFLLARDGTPLVAPYNIYSDFFAVIGLAAYARAVGDSSYRSLARRTLSRIQERLPNPKGPWNKRLPGGQAYLDHTEPMILLGTAGELYRIQPEEDLLPLLSSSLETVMNRHVDEKRKVLYELVAPDGSHPDTPSGRMILPGHAIESMGFVMREAGRRGDRATVDRAATVALWMLERGWDDELEGGILYYLDLEGRPSEMLQWDMKLWWVHIETLDTLLLAYHLTRRPEILEWFERVHAWTWSHFPDPAYGEWFPYVSRDGRVTHPIKGSKWKGCFHVPRGLLHCWQTLEAMARRSVPL